MLVLNNYSSEKFQEYGVWNAVCVKVSGIDPNLDSIEVTLMPPIDKSELPFAMDIIPAKEWTKKVVCGKCGTGASVYGYCPICDSSRVRKYFMDVQEPAFLSSFPCTGDHNDIPELAALAGAKSLVSYWGYLVRSNITPYRYLPDLQETIYILSAWLEEMHSFPSTTSFSDDWSSRVERISKHLSIPDEDAKKHLRESYLNCHPLYYMEIEVMANPFRSSHYAAVNVADAILDQMDPGKSDFLINQDLLKQINLAIQLLESWRQRLYHTFGLFDENTAA